jgi:hypothetical protein
VGDKPQKQRLLKVLDSADSLKIYLAGLEVRSQVTATVPIVLLRQIAK